RAAAIRAARPPTLSWQPEDPERAALGRVRGQIAHRIHEAERGAGVPRIEIARDDGAGPAADAVQDRDVLLTVRTAVGDRLADDSRGRLEAPQQLPRLRVHRLEPAVHRAVEDDVARRRERPTPHGKRL